MNGSLVLIIHVLIFIGSRYLTKNKKSDCEVGLFIYCNILYKHHQNI
jgi:hypothetical protein